MFQIKNSSKHNQFLLFVDVSRDLHHHQKKLVLVLLALDTTRTWTWHARKAVVCVTELIAAFIAIHGLWTFFANVYGLLDQPGKTVWLCVNHCRLGPVNRMILWFACRLEWICWSLLNWQCTEFLWMPIWSLIHILSCGHHQQMSSFLPVSPTLVWFQLAHRTLSSNLFSVNIHGNLRQ